MTVLSPDSTNDLTGGYFTKSFKKSSPDEVCLLLRVTVAPGSSASLDNLSRTSNLTDYNIVPVARSYAGYEWERVAGPYAQSLHTNCFNGGICDLDIPLLPNLVADGKFYLMSFTHSLPERAIVSRFLQQTTFGPTLGMINSWEYATNTLDAMASWVDTQIQISPTYHREYFRARADGPRNAGEKLSLKSYGVRHPCSKDSTWTRVAFREEEYGSIYITATERSDGTMLLSVDGVPRTVVDTWQSIHGENLGTGTFRTCARYCVKLAIQIENGSCIQVKGGNPPINLPFASNLVQSINLPPLNGPTPNTYIPNSYNCPGTELYYPSSSAFSKTQCDSLDPSTYRNLFGVAPDGTQYIYNSYVGLDENSLERPKSYESGYDMAAPVKERCSNPSMAFTNSEYDCFHFIYT